MPTIGRDPKRIALAGGSAGGNLAIDTAIWVGDSHLQAPVAERPVASVVGTDLGTPSSVETGSAVPLNKAVIEWYVAYFTSGATDLGDKRLNVLGEADLKGLPPTASLGADRPVAVRGRDAGGEDAGGRRRCAAAQRSR